MNYELYNMDGKKTDTTISLNKNVFGIKPHEHSVYLTVKSEMAANRQGSSSSKTRGEVRGGGAKPWRQKGTGRARVGSSRNPSRVHGGVAFGPKPHKYSVSVNKKVRRLARRSALSSKLSNNNLVIVDNFLMKSHKTKDFIQILEKFNINEVKVTVLLKDFDGNALLCCRNIKNVLLLDVKSASTYDLLDCNVLLIDKLIPEFTSSDVILTVEQIPECNPIPEKLISESSVCCFNWNDELSIIKY